MSSRTNEPFWWLIFSGGGVIAAFVAPVLIFLTAVAAAGRWPSEASPNELVLSHAHIVELLSHPLTRLGLFVAIAMPLFHCAHRVRHTLEELGLGAFKTLIAGTCYLGAIVFTTILAIILKTM